MGDREAPLLLRDVLLEDVGLDRPGEVLRGGALLLGGEHVEGEQDRRRRVDRHRGRDARPGGCPRRGGSCRRGCRPRPPRARPRPGSGRGRSRSPSGSACRRRPRAPPGRARAGSGSARWSPRRCRSRRTGASSRGGPRYIVAYGPRVNGYSPGVPRLSLGVGGAVLGAVEGLHRVPGEGAELSVALEGAGLDRHWRSVVRALTRPRAQAKRRPARDPAAGTGGLAPHARGPEADQAGQKRGRGDPEAPPEALEAHHRPALAPWRPRASAGSGLTAIGWPTARIIGRSEAESE